MIKAGGRSKINKPSGVRLGRRVGKFRDGRQGESQSSRSAKRKRGGGVELGVPCSLGREYGARPRALLVDRGPPSVGGGEPATS